MTKAVIFDLNGIFIKSPKLSERFEADFGVPISTFLPKLLEIMDKVRRPNPKPAFTYWEPVLKDWGLKLTEQELWDYWFGAEQVSNGMVELARELKAKGIKVIILSNNFKERAEYYEHFPWLHEVIDQAYFSYEHGFIKPDPRAWRLVLDDNGLKPEECLYFDDLEKNIAPAQNLGIKAFLFTNEADLKERLRENL